MTKTIKAEELCHHHVDEIYEVVITIFLCVLPQLSPSHRSLIFVSVNKFNMLRKTFFMLIFFLCHKIEFLINSYRCIWENTSCHIKIESTCCQFNLLENVVGEAFNVKFYCDSCTCKVIYDRHQNFWNEFLKMYVKDVWKTTLNVFVEFATSTIIKNSFKTSFFYKTCSIVFIIYLLFKSRSSQKFCNDSPTAIPLTHMDAVIKFFLIWIWHFH